MKQILQRIAEQAARKTWAKLIAHYGSAIGEMPTIEMNGRLKSTGGRAFLETGKVDFSVSLMIDFPRHYVMDTIPHELAHIAAYRLTGYGLKRGESHGKPWKDIMHTLGLPGDIYHDMLVKRALKQGYRN